RPRVAGRTARVRHRGATTLSEGPTLESDQCTVSDNGVPNAHHQSPRTDCSAVALPGGRGGSCDHGNHQADHQFGGSAPEPSQSASCDASPDRGSDVGDLLGLASTTDSVGGIRAFVRVRQIGPKRRCISWSNVRVIAAVTAHEAWGRSWSALLTSGITPTTDGQRLTWTQHTDDGLMAHCDVALLADPIAGHSASDAQPME